MLLTGVLPPCAAAWGMGLPFAALVALGAAAEGSQPPPAGAPPRFSSGDAAVDAAYVKAVGVIASDVVDGRFIAGENWPQVWTRDTSFSVDLGAGLIQPAVSAATLRGMTEQVAGIGEVWVQDVCGHFGGWPHLTDSIVGAVGAWSVYRLTGDRAFLEWSHRVTANTLARAERDAYDAASGLFRGCSSFMESNSAYPGRYRSSGPLVSRTKALSTNVLYYQGYRVAARMARLLGRDAGPFEARAARLKDAVNARLWMDDSGYYAYYEDENGVRQPRMEGLGEALAVLWEVADAERAQSVLARVPTTPHGHPSLWPPFPEWSNYDGGDADYYHNGMIWPFVQGYWAWAAVHGRSPAVFERELERLVALAQRAPTFQEFYRPADGVPDGSPRQLWSAAGYLSMVHHGLFGMRFEPDGIRFDPLVPARFERLALTGLGYRGMTLDITVIGSGARIAAFKRDGRAGEAFVPADATGLHAVEITMGR